MPNNIIEIEREAKELIAKWCPEFQLVWMRTKRKLGHCDFRRKQIALSTFLVDYGNAETITDVIRHEVAHAITNPKAPAHGREWKMNCRKVGAIPSAHASGFEAPEEAYKYTIHCKCDVVRKTDRKPNPATWNRKQCRQCRSREWVYKFQGKVIELEARPTAVRRRRRYSFGGW